MDDNKYIINQILLKNNMVKMYNVYNLCKATIKIELNDGFASGFFLKLERNHKQFYCIMTNQHVITPENISNQEEIKIKYDNEKKYLIIKLDVKERIIKCFKEDWLLDITIIEILSKDKIDNSFFLLPKYNFYEAYEQIINKDIEIAQYPKGNDLSFSNGKILEIDKFNDCVFYHDADTESGSSGSPIVLKGEEDVIAVHKGTTKDKTKNVGIFIGNVIDIIKVYKKNGMGREFYDNGKLKYEGYYLEDEYDGNGEFHYENGEIYIGQFKNGKKNGDGFIFKNNEVIKKGKFENDMFVRDQTSNDDGDEDNNYDNKIKIEDKDKINSNSYNKHKEDKNNKISYNEIHNNNLMNKDDNLFNINNNLNKDNNNFIDINVENNNHNSFFKDIQIQSYHVFKGLADNIGIVCKCSHKTKDHVFIGYNKVKCTKCPEGKNIETI